MFNYENLKSTLISNIEEVRLEAVEKASVEFVESPDSFLSLSVLPEDHFFVFVYYEWEQNEPKWQVIFKRIWDIAPYHIVLTEEDAVHYVSDDELRVFLPKVHPKGSVQFALLQGLKLLHHMAVKKSQQMQIFTAYRDLEILTSVGNAMANVHNFGQLIGIILNHSKRISSADQGTIYLTEKSPGSDKNTHLRFLRSGLVLDDSDTFLMPINPNSMAGYCAATGEILRLDDVRNLPLTVPYKLNTKYDDDFRYYTKSMLVVPMKNGEGKITGVLQLINRKRNADQKLTIDDMKGDMVIPFSARDEKIISALAGQASVAIERNILFDNIQKLFEGFIDASVTAIEQRDPTTSGHSSRVATLTMGLAKAVNQTDSGTYKKASFDKKSIREIRYASLLHDFGKVGVRENVLLKMKKLFPQKMQEIHWRYRFILQELENEQLRKKYDYLFRNGTNGFADYERKLIAEFEAKHGEYDSWLHLIETANEPSVLEESCSKQLQQISEQMYKTPSGEGIPFLTQDELQNLSILKGSLNGSERMEIESHVTHTYNFLKKIPWTEDLSNVPMIAHGHHEKLNGKGYPQQLVADEIPVQSRMMTISDIYDALVAQDRPYKKAMSTNRALDILHYEVNSGALDADLLDIFVTAKIFNLTNDNN